MFGMKMQIEYDGVGVILRPYRIEEMADVVQGFSSMKVHMYTTQLYAQTLENEEEWYSNSRKSKEKVVWAIQAYHVDQDDDARSTKPIGVTALEDLDIHGSCTSGIVIWDSDWWSKGIASRAHLCRTLYAADYLNRLTINSLVFTPNEASLKAIKNVGYLVTGKRLRMMYRHGQYLDGIVLTWLNPDKVNVLYPEGVPNEYQEGIEQALIALQKARDLVKFP